MSPFCVGSLSNPRIVTSISTSGPSERYLHLGERATRIIFSLQILELKVRDDWLAENRSRAQARRCVRCQMAAGLFDGRSVFAIQVVQFLVKAGERLACISSG